MMEAANWGGLVGLYSRDDDFSVFARGTVAVRGEFHDH
jgi:hypothetical protein